MLYEESVNAAIFRCVASMPVFAGDMRLGFEGESAPGCAIFRMEPVLTKAKRYVHGGSMQTGSFTVSLRCADNDTAMRMRAASLFASLAAYVDEHNGFFCDHVLPCRSFRIRAAASPARIRRVADGAVWEMRFQCDILYSPNKQPYTN